MVNFNHLPLYVPEEKKKPVHGFIYFLFHDEHLIYIGQTLNLPERIAAHRHNKHFTHCKYERVLAESILEREIELIIYYRPILNKPKGGTRGMRDSWKVIGDYVHVSGRGSYALKDGVAYQPGLVKSIAFYIKGNWMSSSVINMGEHLLLRKYNQKTREYVEEKTVQELRRVYSFDYESFSVVSQSEYKHKKEVLKLMYS